MLVDNHGFKSIGALSRLARQRTASGRCYRYRQEGSPGDDCDATPRQTLPVDLAANARVLGARVIRAETCRGVRDRPARRRRREPYHVIQIETDRLQGVPGYESWWDVPVAEVAESDGVRAARRDYETARAAARRYL